MKNKHLAMASRLCAAFLGGYLLTYTFTAALARLLPMDPLDAVIVATLPAFALYVLLIFWIFSRPSPARAWMTVLWALPLGLIGFWTRAIGGSV